MGMDMHSPRDEMVDTQRGEKLMQKFSIGFEFDKNKRKNAKVEPSPFDSIESIDINDEK